MDDFLRDAATDIGVSQVVIETEYYMVDILAIVDRLRERKAVERLERVYDEYFASGRMEPEEAKRYSRMLHDNAGVNTRGDDKFDREGVEKLRALTQQGANSVKGG